MNRKIKWIAILVAVSAFLAFGSLLPAEPLAQRSVVVGFGIDLAEGNQLKISAQILNPGGGKEQSGAETNVVTATDYTIAGAMNQISEKSSHTVALTHCNVVFIGKEIAESNNVYSAINYLISNSYLSENAFLFMTDGKAEELLGSKTGFGNNASLYTQSIVGLYGDYSDIAKKTLQCFVVGYHSLGKSNWLPFVKKEDIPPKIGEQGGSDPQYVFKVNDIAVFYKNEYKGIYSADSTRALNYVSAKLKKGRIEAVGDNEENIVLYLTGNKADKKFDLETKTVSVNISIDAILKEIIDSTSEDKFIDRSEITPTEIARTEEKIKSDVLAFYSEMQSKNVDIYNLLEGFDARYGKKSDGLTIGDIKMEVKVTLNVE